MADLYEKREYEETIESGLKAWAWLKKVFTGKSNTDDNEFQQLLIQEAKNASRLLDNSLDSKLENEDTIDNNFAKDFIETANVRDEYINNQSKLESTQINNEKQLDSNDIGETKNKLDNNIDNGFVKDFIETANIRNEYVNKEEEKGNTLESNSIDMQESTENLNYFGRKSIEQQHSIQDKENFKNEFKQYASKMMNADELKVLIGLLNMKSPPSKLNKEHKDLLRESLSLAQNNNQAYNHLDNAFKAMIRTNLGQTIGTQSIKDFIDFMNNPKTLLDIAIKEDSMSSIIHSMKKINNNTIPKETIIKLDSLINPLGLGKTNNAVGRTLEK